MKNPIIIAIAAASIFFQSCASIAPSVPNVIIPQEKGEVNLSASAGLPNLSANASVAVSKNIAVVGSVNGSLGLLGNKRFGFEGGVQFNKFLNKNFAISATPSYSVGNWKNIMPINDFFGNIQGNWNAKSLFVQGQYFFTNEKDNKLSIGGGIRATHTTLFDKVSKHEIRKPKYATSIEPIGMLIMEHKKFGMFIMSGFDMSFYSTKENEIIDNYRSPLLLTAGINFKIGQ